MASLYIANNSNPGAGTVSVFDSAAFGPTKNALLTIPAKIVGLLLSGGTLYVASTMPGSDVITIGSYDPTSGAQINPSLISIPGTFRIMHLNGSNLFVQVAIGPVGNGNVVVNAYTASTGAYLGQVSNTSLGLPGGFTVG